MDNKKVIDIFSPKEIKKEETRTVGKKVEASKKVSEPPPLVPRVQSRPSSFPIKRYVLMFGFGFLALALAFVFFTLSKANIEIWPETETLTLKTKLTIDSSVADSNFLTKVIPGEIFEKEKTVTENFPASGRAIKEGKAEGKILVYNAYSVSPQVLIATTRFVSSDGKIFRTLVKVTIPGGHYEKGKFIPGEVEIKVVADEAGSEYNIGPSTFSVPGFAGTDRYTKFYAKSFTQFTGGFLQESLQVTKEDLEKAKDAVTKKAKEESETYFKDEFQLEKGVSGFIFLEKAIQTEIMETFSVAKIGDEVNNFNYQVKAKSKTLIFSKENLNNFAKEFVITRVPEGKKLYTEGLEIDFKPETINLNSKKIILGLEISAKTYPDIDISNLKNVLRGKSLAETKISLENQPWIARTVIEFWPFWVRSVPDNLDKINLELRVD